MAAAGASTSWASRPGPAVLPTPHDDLPTPGPKSSAVRNVTGRARTCWRIGAFCFHASRLTLTTATTAAARRAAKTVEQRRTRTTRRGPPAIEIIFPPLPPPRRAGQRLESHDQNELRLEHQEGLSAATATGPDCVSDTSAQQNLINYAQELATPPPGPVAPDTNIRSSAVPSSIVLSVMQPIDDNSFLFPNDTVSRDFDVVIPDIAKNKINALEFQIYVLYARTTRLTLGNSYQSVVSDFASCAHDEQSSWFIDQSALVRFTRGAQIIFSNWCADLVYPHINWGVYGAPGVHDSMKVKTAIGAAIGVERSSRNDIFVLPQNTVPSR